MPPLDPEVAAFLEKQKGQPPRSSLDVAATREMMRRAAALAGEPPALAKIEDRVVSGVRAREYVPVEGELPLLVYFHGGRFFSGDLESHDPLCRILARACGCRVLAVDYRMGPEHRFPAALDDACAAVQWAVEQGSPVGVAGDSAGASLAIGAALAVRDPRIRCQVLIYPMIDAACQSASYKEFAEGFGPGAEDMIRGWREYLPEGTDPHDPRVSPIYAKDLTGLPPAYVLTAECDTLRDEGEVFATQLAASGVPVLARRCAGVIHGFFTMPGVLRVAREAMHECAAFVRSQFGNTKLPQ